MKKLKILGILLIMAFTLSACAKPHMVKCPECGHTFDAQDEANWIDRDQH